jgi:hypothetical protein
MIRTFNSDGKRAWRKEKACWVEEQRKLKESGRQTLASKEPRFSEIPVSFIWKFLCNRIEGLNRIWAAHHPEDEQNGVLESIAHVTNQQWTTQDLYQGLTPKSFTQEWKTMFKTTTSIARYMVGKFVRGIEEFGRTEIWNRRCEITIEWERENNITTMSKRARGRNCVEGHRRNRDDFIRSSFRSGLLTDEKELRKVADERLLESYLRRLDLNVMERLDSCKFLMTEGTG